MPRSLRFLSSSAAGVAALAGLLLAARWNSDAARSPSSQAAGSAPGPELKSVETVLPRRQTMSRSLDVPGTFEAYERVDVHARVSGYASEVRVDIGDRVKGQDVLVVLSVPEMVQELVEARAVLRGARAQLEIASPAELAAAEAAVEQARSKLEVDHQMSALERVDVEFLERQLERKRELQAEAAATDEAVDMAAHARDAARAELAVAESRALESRSALARAEADLALARARIDVAAADVDLAEARVQRLETLSEYSRLRAPFDGVVTDRAIDPGALVQAATGSAGAPLLTVQRTDRMRVSFDVPEVDLPFVAPGARAVIRPFAAVGSPLEGTVRRIANSLQTRPRTMRAEIELENPDGRFFDGMYSQVSLDVDVRPDVLTLPAAALLVEAGKSFVYVVVDELVEKREIQVGLDDGIDVEVREGLSAGDPVVVAGAALISAGERVRAVPRPSSEGRDAVE